MIESGSDCDANLDLVLATRTDPLVPSDLARRIVVRTTCLPQLLPRENRHSLRRLRRPAPLAEARRFGLNGWPLGAAMAACLALFVIGQLTDDAPVANADAVELASAYGATPYTQLGAAALGAHVAKGLAAPTAEAPARSAPAAITRPLEHAVERSPAQSLTSAASDPDKLSAPQLALSDKSASEMLVSYADLASDRSDVSGFTLTENDPKPAAVYGPSLEPEANWSHAGLSGRSPTSVGLAAASRAAR